MYGRLRDLSMSRDDPPRFLCHPLSSNREDRLYVQRGEEETRYHQERLDHSQIPTPSNTLDDCYTCVNHKNCGDVLCRARRLTCYYCESKEGPLHVKANVEQRRRRNVREGIKKYFKCFYALASEIYILID